MRPRFDFNKNTNSQTSKKEAVCERCKKTFSIQDLIETISPSEDVEFYCKTCLDFLDNYFKQEVKKERLRRLKESVKK